MDGITAYLAIVAATILLPAGQPLTVRLADEHALRQAERMDGIRVNGVIYYDAPIRSALPILR